MKISLSINFPLCYLEIFNYFSRHDKFLNIFKSLEIRLVLKNTSKISRQHLGKVHK